MSQRKSFSTSALMSAKRNSDALAKIAKCIIKSLDFLQRFLTKLLDNLEKRQHNNLHFSHMLCMANRSTLRSGGGCRREALRQRSSQRTVLASPFAHRTTLCKSKKGTWKELNEQLRQSSIQ